MSQSYAHPETLVESQWVLDHLTDPQVRLIEADEDPVLYDTGHIPGAVKLDWHVDVQDPVRRDFIDHAGFETLAGRWGIHREPPASASFLGRLFGRKAIQPETTVVLYGDRNNWYAAYTFWLFRLYGHSQVKILNEGRTVWEAQGHPYTREVPSYPVATYHASAPDLRIRAFQPQVESSLGQLGVALVDVRSPEEYQGTLTHMVNYPQEGASREGHIPGARSIPWAKAANADGTFKAVEDLQALYHSEGITPDKAVMSYCRIGERSAPSLC